MPSTTDNEYAALAATYGAGLSMSDMKYKKYGGPKSPAQSFSDLEDDFWGPATDKSLTDKKYAALGGSGSMSDQDSTASSGGGSLIDQLFAQQTFFVGHRGSGDTWPEHSQAAYQGAFDGGAKALEFSVQITSEGTWFHLHDAGATGLNRTTNRTGDPSALTNAQLDTTFITKPDVGWYWTDNQQKLPKFLEMMALFYGRCVIFLESKVYTNPAWDGLIAILDAQFPGYQKSVIWKSHVGGVVGMDKAKAKGMKVWCYVDAPLVPAQLDTAATYDYIGIPVADPAGGSSFTDAEINSAVAKGKPVIEWSARTRFTRDKLKKPNGLGVQGFVTSMLPYTQVNVPNRTQDQFASGKFAPGDLPADSSRLYTLDKPNGSLKFAGLTSMPSVCLGSLSPAGNLFTIDYDFMIETLPSDLTLHHGIVFSKVDDQRWQFQSSTNATGGYHIILRANGQMALYSHPPNNSANTVIGVPTIVNTDPLVAGQWNHVQIEVTATQVTAQRTTGSVTTKIVANDTQYRGTYFHFTRNYPIAAANEAVHFKNVVVVQK